MRSQSLTVGFGAWGLGQMVGGLGLRVYGFRAWGLGRTGWGLGFAGCSQVRVPLQQSNFNFY